MKDISTKKLVALTLGGISVLGGFTLISATIFKIDNFSIFTKENNEVAATVEAVDSNVAIGNSGPVSQTINKMPPPRISYEFLSPSTLQRDGLYHAKIYLTVGFVVGLQPTGTVAIMAAPLNPSLKCTSTSTPPSKDFDTGVPAGAGKTEETISITPWNSFWDCTSSKPIVDDGKLFRYTATPSE